MSPQKQVADGADRPRTCGQGHPPVAKTRERSGGSWLPERGWGTWGAAAGTLHSFQDLERWQDQDSERGQAPHIPSSSEMHLRQVSRPRPIPSATSARAPVQGSGDAPYPIPWGCRALWVSWVPRLAPDSPGLHLEGGSTWKLRPRRGLGAPGGAGRSRTPTGRDRRPGPMGRLAGGMGQAPGLTSR